MKYNSFVIVAFLTFGTNCALADSIELRTGKIIEGEITAVSSEQIEILSGKQTHKLPYRKIAKISESSGPEGGNTANLKKALDEFRKVDNHRNKFHKRMTSAAPKSKIEIFIADPSATTPEPSNTTIPQAIGSAKAAKKVELYMTSWCPWCLKTIAFLDSQGVNYIKYDIEKDSFGGQEYNRRGFKGIPVVVIGDEVIRGYSPEGIKMALEK